MALSWYILIWVGLPLLGVLGEPDCSDLGLVGLGLAEAAPVLCEALGVSEMTPVANKGPPGAPESRAPVATGVPRGSAPGVEILFLSPFMLDLQIILKCNPKDTVFFFLFFQLNLT